MSHDRLAGMIWLLGGLILVGSALIARRLPARRMLGLALMWVGIFAAFWGVAWLVQR